MPKPTNHAINLTAAGHHHHRPPSRPASYRRTTSPPRLLSSGPITPNCILCFTFNPEKEKEEKEKKNRGKQGKKCCYQVCRSLAFAILDPIDFLALQSIRKSLDDTPGSNYFSTWDFTSDPCNFAGVYCDGDKVIALNLGDPKGGGAVEFRCGDLSYGGRSDGDGDIVLQAYDQHLNMILGDVEEIVTTVEIDDETYEEIVRVSKQADNPFSFCTGRWRDTGFSTSADSLMEATLHIWLDGIMFESNVRLLLLVGFQFPFNLKIL
ncbi:hypothetical protein RHGRI_016555 [Rhododendron griersonianum]|uniref:Leucine-rich repeat-containing N-terminal plant-type domain-containing protein n=1 Tax=Rhododendron griersonianum TaxID=479676 RepID=A0AAV6JUI6_9ERIC|nr:hypothetical protein RHGRI_016555 [Rhododendron griersonianum]